MPPPTPSRPPSLVAAAAATVGLAVFFVVMAVLSLGAGHGSFSGGVALALVLWSVLVGGAGIFLWRGAAWARGPVVAAGLLHVLAFGQFALNAPWAVLGAIAGLVAVVGAVIPVARGSLNRER